jgi:hypothetical protein
MGERTAGLDTTTSNSKQGQAPRSAAEELGTQIALVRQELDSLLGELDRRRHEVLDVPLQLRRHVFGASLTVLAFFATAAGSVWLTARRRRQRQRLGMRVGRFHQALARMTEHPERVAAEPTIPAKIATAAANAAVAALVKKLLEGAVTRIMEAGSTATPAPRPQAQRAEPPPGSNSSMAYARTKRT